VTHLRALPSLLRHLQLAAPHHFQHPAPVQVRLVVCWSVRILFSSFLGSVAFPTSKPTASPVSHPTGLPTSFPTSYPSSIPSSQPSSSPSISTKPSPMPSFVPTLAPSVQTLPELIFTSNITLTGITTTGLGASDQQAIVNATATSMDIPMASVTYTGAVAGSSSSSAVINSKTMRGSINIIRSSSTSIIAITKTSQLIEDGQNATALYNSLVNKLSVAVSTGTFTQTLNSVSVAYGATQTASAVATSVSSSQPTVEEVPTTSSSSSSSSSLDLSAGAVSGIVIGSVAAVALCIFGAYYAIYIYRPALPSSSSASQSSPSASSSVSPPPSSSSRAAPPPSPSSSRASPPPPSSSSRAAPPPPPPKRSRGKGRAHRNEMDEIGIEL
jgi:hypothetical protein